MRQETMTLGATPCDEPCAQAGVTTNYTAKARRESGIYLRQLARILKAADKTLPDGTRLRVRGQTHDGPTYYEVEVVFPDGQWEVPMWLENNLPAKWDEKAQQELLCESE